MLRIRDIPEDKVVIYDIETTGVDAPYCNLEMISYQLGLRSEPKLVDLASAVDCERFRKLLSDPDIIKVSYNGINFDDIVLMRYGYYVEPTNRHDMLLALKTVVPNLPSYSLKFVSWYYFNDWHEPKRKLDAWLTRKNLSVRLIKDQLSMHDAPPELLGVYCQHDVRETANVFRMVWENVQDPKHWKVYNEMELGMAEPLHEMILIAGEWLDPEDIEQRITKLSAERNKLMAEVRRCSCGMIQNPNSSLQVSRYLSEEAKIELKLSEAGNYMLRKDELLELMPTNPIAKLVFEIRDLGKLIQHYTNYLTAAYYEFYKDGQPNKLKRFVEELGSDIEGLVIPDKKSWDHKHSISRQFHSGELNGEEAIPKGYSLSGARTRRFLSNSMFGINFQNQNRRTKVIQLVPKGWLGCWIDSRQIENIVHIWASKDGARREAYEADLDWNEYVWIANQILGTDYSRKDLEETESPVNPKWSIYKTYKTTKLAMNFFMGIKKFAKTTGLAERQAFKLFGQVHKACPAMRGIIPILMKQFKANDGYISDPFGHIYMATNEQKMVVHLVQGCGTGSVPKAMTIANYKTLHSLDTFLIPRHCPYVHNEFTGRYSYGLVCGTTHDECAFRISLGLPTKTIIKLIRGCLYNMEQRFSDKFDGIPLRAQLAVSITNAGEMVELNHNDPKFEERLINEYIRVGKSKF